MTAEPTTTELCDKLIYNAAILKRMAIPARASQGGGEVKPLTEKQWDVLSSLANLRRRSAASMHRPFVDGVRQDGWYAPMEFDGRDGSHHSGTAKALAKRGLVDRHKGGINNFKSRSKSAAYYRITADGLALYEALRAKKLEVKS